MQAYQEIYNLIHEIPKEIEQAELLITTIEEAKEIYEDQDRGWWGKLRELTSIADERLPQVLESLKTL